jgi:sialate O-acetylesterase
MKTGIMRTPPLLAVAAALCLHAAGPASAQERPLLHPLFSDHGVIQREAPVLVHGSASPGSEIQVSLGPVQARAIAGDDGRWRAELPPLEAGGPYTLTAQGDGRTEAVSDVMIGDVWLCSGQSNMVLEIARALDAPAEIGAANDPMIRAMTLPLRTAATPLREFQSDVSWQVVSPGNAASVSAACYFMARELRRHHDIPMGLIISAWGGSSITAWMSEEALARAGADAQALATLALYRENAPEAMARWGARWEDWWLGQTGEAREDAPWTDDLDISAWPVVPALTYWEDWGDPALTAHDGMVWYRTRFHLTADQAAQGAVLHIGRADEVDQTWLNGAPVGGMANPSLVRAYELPPGRLRAGENTLTINVLDTWRSGGLVGPDDLRAIVLEDGSEIVLDGEWRYHKVDAGFGRPPGAPWSDTGGYSQIANAMIAPLEGVSLAGVAWYQGESDTHDGRGYGALLEALIADWRGRFRANLPFLVVQLAGFGPHPSAPGDNGWADLRESQRLVALTDPHTAIVAAHDLGEIHDIHPPGKQELGRRLALAARHLVHGETGIAPSGPLPAGISRENGELTVHFEGVSGALATLGSDRAIGFELCSDEACRYADARLSGPESVMIEGVRATDTRLRFCWAMNPLCNLTDTSDRPPVPFEQAIQR